MAPTKWHNVVSHSIVKSLSPNQGHAFDYLETPVYHNKLIDFTKPNQAYYEYSDASLYGGKTQVKFTHTLQSLIVNAHI